MVTTVNAGSNANDMADDEDHQVRLAKFLALANITVDFHLARGIRNKFTGRRFCMMLGGTIKDWWDDDRFQGVDGNSLFTEDQIILFKALPSYINYKQIHLGPKEDDDADIFELTDIDSVTEVDTFLMSHDPDHRIMYSRTEALNIMREKEEADHARRLRLRAEAQLEEEHLARMERIRSGEYTRSRVPSSDLSTSEDDPLIPGMTQGPKKDSVKKEEDYGEDHAAREKAREEKRDHDNAVKKWSAKKREVSMFEKLEDDVKFPKWHKDFRATPSL